MVIGGITSAQKLGMAVESLLFGSPKNGKITQAQQGTAYSDYIACNDHIFLFCDFRYPYFFLGILPFQTASNI